MLAKVKGLPPHHNAEEQFLLHLPLSLFSYHLDPRTDDHHALS